MKVDCYFCHIKTIQKLIEKFKPENDLAEDFVFAVHEFLYANRDMINPQLARCIHRIAKEKLKVNDLYAKEKYSTNMSLLRDYSLWQSYIDISSNPLFTATKLAVVGNIIDYGAHSLDGDLTKQINSLLSNSLKINQTEELKQAIKKANSILYIGDNAGEIIFDKLFIETINHPNVTFATRGYPVINDVTIEDAELVGVDKICKVISNGFDAPSTLLEFCSDEFMETYTNADLIISKGQGNFEGLMNENHPNTFFLLIAKCMPVAELLKCNKYDMVVTKFNAN